MCMILTNWLHVYLFKYGKPRWHCNNQNWYYGTKATWNANEQQSTLTAANSMPNVIRCRWTCACAAHRKAVRENGAELKLVRRNTRCTQLCVSSMQRAMRMHTRHQQPKQLLCRYRIKVAVSAKCWHFNSYKLTGQRASATTQANNAKLLCIGAQKRWQEQRRCCCISLPLKLQWQCVRRFVADERATSWKRQVQVCTYVQRISACHSATAAIRGLLTLKTQMVSFLILSRVSFSFFVFSVLIWAVISNAYLHKTHERTARQ